MNEERLSFWLFLGLLVITSLSVTASRVHLPKEGAVAVALGFAAVKAFLIGWFFMRLRSSGWVPRAVVIVGVLAVAILALGILPDVGIYNNP